MDNIKNGIYSPKTRLNQRELATELDMSYVSIREGLGTLQQHGWIECRPRQGTFVKELKEEEFEEIYKFREMLELAAITYLAETISDEQLAKLESVVFDLEEACKSHNADLYEQSDFNFHRLLLTFVDNKKAQEAHESALLQARLLFPVIAKGATGFFNEAYQEDRAAANHKGIYCALKAHKKDLAQRLIQQHIGHTCNFFKELRKYLGY